MQVAFFVEAFLVHCLLAKHVAYFSLVKINRQCTSFRIGKLKFSVAIGIGYDNTSYTCRYSVVGWRSVRKACQASEIGKYHNWLDATFGIT